jgi:hypothetical protein
MSWRGPDRSPRCSRGSATRCSGAEVPKELAKARKHSAMLQSKLDGAFIQYHNEVQDMQAKSNELVQKNKSLHNKNKGMPLTCRVLIEVPCSSLTSSPVLFAELETQVE